MNEKYEIIISTIGTKGDIYPLAGIAMALLSRDLKVVFLSNPKFKDYIENCQIPFEPIGTLEQYEEFHFNKEIWNPHKDTTMLGFDNYFLPATLDAYKYVEARHKQGANMMVLTLGVTNGARIAADKYSIPNGIIALSPNKFFSIYSPPAPLCWIYPKILPELLAPVFYKTIYLLWNSKIGSKYLKKLHVHIKVKSKLYPHSYNYDKENLLIGFFPEWFGMRARDWPKKIKLVGFSLHDEINQKSRTQIDSFIAKKGPPIVFTTGTGVHDTSDIFREGRRICETLNMPGIFVGGQLGKELLNGAELCQHVNYVDFEYTLPKCQAIIHHGGIGTTAQAIRAGIPQLIRPLAFDQPDNANRIHKLGLGTFIFPEHFNAETAAPILKAMIDYAPHNKNLAMYSADLKRSNAIEKACDLIEEKLLELEKRGGHGDGIVKQAF